MKHTYLIREGKQKVTETNLGEVAQLIEAGKLKFTGKKSKWNAIIDQLEMRYFYMRVNRPPRENPICMKPCCRKVLP